MKKLIAIILIAASLAACGPAKKDCDPDQKNFQDCLGDKGHAYGCDCG